MSLQREIAEKHLGRIGKLISNSKSGYLENYPKNKVYFNANVFTEGEKIWYGDLDVTLSIENLQGLSDDLNSNLYILREMDGRFGNEENPRLENSVLKISPNSKIKS
jgi:hypothetical protein